jgi:hypothetical protein
VSTVAVARVLYRLVDGGSDRSWKRRVCPETQPGSNKCNAAIVPQRLHGSLLKRSDRRRACPELSEAKPRKSFARVPNRRQSDCPGSATGSRVDCFSESSGSSYACAKYVHAKYVRTKYVCTERARGRGAANRDSAAECCWRRQAQPGATQKRSAVLWRGLQGPLRRDSTGRLGVDCLSDGTETENLKTNVLFGPASGDLRWHSLAFPGRLKYGWACIFNRPGSASEVTWTKHQYRERLNKPLSVELAGKFILERRQGALVTPKQWFGASSTQAALLPPFN